MCADRFVFWSSMAVTWPRVICSLLAATLCAAGFVCSWTLAGLIAALLLLVAYLMYDIFSTGRGAAGETHTNGFCELNFAKSCVDAVANKDYSYYARALGVAWVQG